MDLWTSDDELLLMELERRDGIYSFIFHELENNKLQTELLDNQNKLKQIKQESQETLKLNEDFAKRQIASSSSNVKEAKSSTSKLLTPPTNAAKSYSYGDCYVKSSTIDLGKSWQTHFNFPFPMASTTHTSFKRFCSLRTFSVRKAKSPIPHIHTPLVRNRHHELKENREYINFMQNIIGVADLRRLFPLDPDVHAPFTVENENVKDREPLVKDDKFLN